MKNKNEEFLPYYEKARETLDYNLDTGEFTRFIKSRLIHKEMGRINSKGYRQIGITINGKQKQIRSHRLAWFIYYGELPNVIDHIDKNKLNNRITNLRSCTDQENNFNRGIYSNNTSGYKGVSWNKRCKKWTSHINSNGSLIRLGSFDCPKKASKAYQAKAKEIHREFYNEG
mgnify:CR=1 FL=1